jgi:hypothetical protein
VLLLDLQLPARQDLLLQQQQLHLACQRQPLVPPYVLRCLLSRRLLRLLQQQSPQPSLHHTLYAHQPLPPLLPPPQLGPVLPAAQPPLHHLIGARALGPCLLLLLPLLLGLLPAAQTPAAAQR